MSDPALTSEPSPLSQAAATTARTDPLPLAAALAALDPADDTHWTANGKPNVAAVAGIVGAPVTRADIDSAAPELTRDGAPAAADEPQPAAPAAVPDELLRAHQRLNVLEEDIAFLRATLGWPTKDRT